MTGAMRISRVTLDVRDAAAWAAFYGDVLGLPVERVGENVEVRAGWTTISLRSNPQVEGCHHLAFTISANKFDAAKQWIAGRAEILSKGEADEFEYDAGWNARSFYFPGPDLSVLEFIIRRDLGNETAGDFGGDDILCVSEVGVPVSSVPETVDYLSREAGLEPYGVVPRESFAPVGDIEGMVILVSENRTWFPVDDRLSAASRTVIEATGERPGEYSLGGESLLVVRSA